MEDLKEKIIYLQDELITCLRKISRLEDDKRTIEYLKDSTIESLKREIEKFKAEKMKLEYSKCKNDEYSKCKNDEYSCETITETTASSNYSLFDEDFTSSNNNYDIACKKSIEC